MNSEDLKLVVKEKYGKIAEQSDAGISCGCGSSCCGTNEEYTIFSESYEAKDGYNVKME